MPELIFCANGNKTFARLAIEAGWLYGACLPWTVYFPPYFADQDYKQPNREAYMTALAKHKPTVATVLDWQHPEQKGEVLSWAAEAARIVSRVIIIPKVPGTGEEIPACIGGAEVVLGYSVPTSYGGTTVPVWEIGRRPVHLLGGSPQRQREFAQYLNVVSLDGNMAGMQARRCRFWSRKPGKNGHWVQLADTGDTRTEGAHHEAFRRSCQNIREAWGSMVRCCQGGRIVIVRVLFLPLALLLAGFLCMGWLVMRVFRPRRDNGA